MSLFILDTALFIAHVMLGFAMLIAGMRIIIGPRAQDRVLALDTFYVNALLFLVLFSIRAEDSVYMELALIIALLGFAATFAFAKFLMRGEVIE